MEGEIKKENKEKTEIKQEEKGEKEKKEIKQDKKESEKEKSKGKVEENKEKKIEKEKPDIKVRVRGKDLEISPKHSFAICRFIKGKNPGLAIELLEKVISKKIAVPMKGEIPHRKNMPKGKVAGRFPIKASKKFIKLLKSLIANAAAKGINKEELVISLAKADKASKPHRATRIAFGRKRFKRTNVLLEAELKTEMGAKKK